MLVEMRNNHSNRSSLQMNLSNIHITSKLMRIKGIGQEAQPEFLEDLLPSEHSVPGEAAEILVICLGSISSI